MEINRRIFNTVQNEIDNGNIEVRFFKAYGEGSRYGIMYITRDDDVYGIGYNGDFNLLGLSGEHFLKKRVDQSVKIPKLCGKRIKHICVGDHLAVGLGGQGELYEWGLPYSGMRSSYDRSSIQLPHLKTSCVHCVSVLDCGGGFFATITNRRKVFMWGYIDWSAPFSDGRLFSPMHKEVVSVACGTWHMIILTADGKVYSCGYGQLGYEWNVENGYWRIEKIPLKERVVKVAAGSVSTMCITESNVVWACGLNHSQFGYLGVDSEEPNVHNPQRVKIDDSVVSVAVSYSLSSLRNAYAAKTRDGGAYYVWGWGSAAKFPIRVETSNRFVKLFDALPTPPDLCCPDAPDGEEELAVQNGRQVTAKLPPELPPLFDKVETTSPASPPESSASKPSKPGKFDYFHLNNLSTTNCHVTKTVLHPRRNKFLEANSVKSAEPLCDDGAYKSYLDYVYSGGTKRLLFTELLDVHILAVHYEENQLIEHTMDQIRSQIDVSNFSSILERAQTHRSDNLMSLCHSFIANLCGEPEKVAELITSLRISHH